MVWWCLMIFNSWEFPSECGRALVGAFVDWTLEGGICWYPVQRHYLSHDCNNEMILPPGRCALFMSLAMSCRISGRNLSLLQLVVRRNNFCRHMAWMWCLDTKRYGRLCVGRFSCAPGKKGHSLSKFGVYQPNILRAGHFCIIAGSQICRLSLWSATVLDTEKDN